MKNNKLNILDCSLQNRVKPIQNLSLIIFTVSWVFIFILLFFKGNWTNILFYAFIVLSLISLLITIVSSLIFFKKTKIGTVEIDEKTIILNNSNIYNTEDCYFDLNISLNKGQDINEDIITKLPFWGNYIIQKKDNTRIEFEPNTSIIKYLPYIKIQNSKRPALSMKTTDLFNNLMSLLWAAS